VILIALFFFALPVTAQELTFNIVSFNGFRFQYPHDLAASLQISFVPGDDITLYPEGASASQPAPPHTEFFLTTTTPYQNQAFVLADRLRVYRIADLAGYSTYYMDQVTTLQNILAEQPDLTTIERTLPHMPFTSSQAIRIREAYIETETLHGIRYMSEFLPGAVFPIGAGNFVYTFQALSSDGLYYVAADFHTSTSLFPPDLSFMGYTQGNFEMLTEEYFQAAQAVMDGAQPADFTPNLTVLDEIFASMEMEG
jgi:hypothetical protein